jgi:UDP-glucose:(heptosyl)LPS alpha-1,3-glucosyltransferase
MGLPASDRTRFLDSVADMAELMEAADVFVLPTIYDPFSNASLEALAAGLPVITTTANGFSEIMRPGLDGEALADPSDIDGIAAAIEKWRTPVDRDARRETARQYSIEANLEATLAALGVPVTSR